MHTEYFTPWDNYPKFLPYREFLNPLSFVADLFGTSSLKEHKSYLTEWRYYVISEDCYHDEKFGPGQLLHTYKLTVTLVEALYVIFLNYEAVYPKPEIPSESQLLEEKESWLYYPKNLSLKAFQNPYRAIGKTFKGVSLPEYREHLFQWLTEGLSIKRTAERMDAADVLMVYDSLLNLYSVAWVLLQRSTMATVNKE